MAFNIVQGLRIALPMMAVIDGMNGNCGGGASKCRYWQKVAVSRLQSAALCQAVVRKFSWMTEPPLIFLAMYINGTYTRGTSAAQCLVAFDDGIVFMVHITTSISVADHRSIEQDVACQARINQKILW